MVQPLLAPWSSYLADSASNPLKRNLEVNASTWEELKARFGKRTARDALDLAESTDFGLPPPSSVVPAPGAVPDKDDEYPLSISGNSLA